MTFVVNQDEDTVGYLGYPDDGKFGLFLGGILGKGFLYFLRDFAVAVVHVLRSVCPLNVWNLILFYTLQGCEFLADH